jgi:hypothetical protein
MAWCAAAGIERVCEAVDFRVRADRGSGCGSVRGGEVSLWYRFSEIGHFAQKLVVLQQSAIKITTM